MRKNGAMGIKMINFLHEMANVTLLGLMEHLHGGDIWVRSPANEPEPSMNIQWS